MIKQGWRVLALLVGLLTLTLTACSAGGPGSSNSAEERSLTIGTTVAPSTLNPSVNDAAAIPEALLYNVYETLIRIDSEGKLTLLLASDYQISPDRKTYTFDIRPGAKFASGSPVDAQAVAKSMEYIRSNPDVSPTLKRQMSPVETISVVKDNTVAFQLSRPSNQWLYQMASTLGIIYDPKGIDAGDLATKPQGSGPYIFSEYKQGESLTLKKNSDYWGTPVHVAGVTFRYFSDPNAMNNAMLSGELDIIGNVAAPQALSQFSDTTRFATMEGTTNGEVVLGFNNARDALKDSRVRKAINYAIDRRALLDAVWAGKGKLIGSMVPPTDPWFEDLSNVYSYDPAKAKQLLAEAGLANGLTLALRIPTLPYAVGAATYITSQLKDVGITVNVEQLEFPARWIDEVLVKGNYDMTIVAHVEGRDIDRFADPKYYWHYNNPEFTALINQADQAPDEQRIDLMKKAARILATDAAADFLWLMPRLVVTKADIIGFPANATSLSYDLTSVAVKSG